MAGTPSGATGRAPIHHLRRTGLVLLVLPLVVSACSSTLGDSGGTDSSRPRASSATTAEAGTAASGPETTESTDTTRTDEPTGTTQPDLGRVPALENLAFRCHGGSATPADYKACDELALVPKAPPGYHDYGASCGGRVEHLPDTVASCEAFLRPPAVPRRLAASLNNVEELRPVADACRAGTMSACDDLRGTTAGYITYGSTCGRRLKESIGTLCTALFRSGEAPREPNTLARDGNSRTLAERCHGDDGLASCDDLRASAEPGGDYSTYAATCGGRLKIEPASCVGFYRGASVRPVDAVPAGGSTTVAALLQQCRVDLASCDNGLKDPAASPDQRTYASTCAGRNVPLTEGCVAAYGQTTPSAATDPSSLGRDGTAEVLAASCADGALKACDDLRAAKHTPRAYQDFGARCGDRLVRVSDCVQQFGAATPPDPGDTKDLGMASKDLRTLAGECEKSQLSACDSLATNPAAPVHYQAYGRMCGDLNIDPGAAGMCVKLYGAKAAGPDALNELGRVPDIESALGRCVQGNDPDCDVVLRDAFPDSGYRTRAIQACGGAVADDAPTCAARRAKSVAATAQPATTVTAPQTTATPSTPAPTTAATAGATTSPPAGPPPSPPLTNAQGGGTNIENNPVNSIAIDVHVGDETAGTTAAPATTTSASSTTSTTVAPTTTTIAHQPDPPIDPTVLWAAVITGAFGLPSALLGYLGLRRRRRRRVVVSSARNPRNQERVSS